MSDTAFKTAAFPGYTTKELQDMVDECMAMNISPNPVIVAEITRRARAAEGDQSVMTQGERLRFLRTGKAR